MQTVTLKEAEAKLAELVESGESFVIERPGRPAVEVTMVPLGAPGKRRYGFMDGMFEIPDDFDTMFQKEIEEMFYGEE